MTDWLDDEQQAAWVRLIAMVELLPGVIDALTPGQVEQLTAIAGAILERVDPDGTMSPR